MLFLATMVLALVSTACLGTPAATPEQEEGDTFFSGTVDEVSGESTTVTREVPGSPPEHRTFAINAQTKIEGKLVEGARVTVKFRPADEGMIAETIIVREPAKTKKKP